MGAKEAKWSSADWVVKVDPDAVFVPARLRRRLENTYEAEGGSYFVNCPYVDYGFFGNLELFSKTAFSTLLDNIDDCKADTKINWRVGVKNGKYGPMGEDLFAQACVDKRDEGLKKDKKFKPHCSWAYGSTLHPFKKVAEWDQCYQETMTAYPEPL